MYKRIVSNLKDNLVTTSLFFKCLVRVIIFLPIHLLIYLFIYAFFGWVVYNIFLSVFSRLSCSCSTDLSQTWHNQKNTLHITLLICMGIWKIIITVFENVSAFDSCASKSLLWGANSHSYALLLKLTIPNLFLDLYNKFL